MITSNFRTQSAPENGFLNTSIDSSVPKYLMYTPQSEGDGEESFIYELNKYTNPASVNIYVFNAKDITLRTTENTRSESTSISATNVHEDVQYAIFQYPSNGTLTLNGSNVEYQPNADFSGTDTATYSVTYKNVTIKNNNIRSRIKFKFDFRN